MFRLHKIMKKIILVCLILFFFIGSYWFGLRYSKSSLEPFVVRLGWVNQAQFAAFYVAKDKGFYERKGLDVHLVEADQAVNQAEEIAQAKVDASIMEAHQVLGSGDAINSLLAVAAIYQINPHVLAARADSDIKEIQDFSGKTVGFSGGKSEGSALFESFLSQKLSSPVNFVELGFNTVDDFKNKRADIIDVYRIDQPYLAQREGVDLVQFPLEAYGFNTFGDVIVVNRTVNDQDPDRYHRFVHATIQGLEYALNNPEEAIDISLKHSSGLYADRSYQEHIFYESIPLIRGEGKTLGVMDLLPWKTLYEAMRKANAVEPNLDIEKLYTNRYVIE